MNKLVIIGNGFDLAHGLPTSYGHFIDWYWEKVFKKLHSQNTSGSIYYEDNLLRFDLNLFGNYSLSIVNSFKAINSYTAFEKFLVTIQENHYYNDENHSFTYYNSFFQIINNRKSVQNWVDIENEYYKLLKDCLNERDNVKVKQLNIEFEQVKKLLEDYLYDDVAQKFDFANAPDQIEFLKIFEIRAKFLDKNNNLKYLKEFPKEDYAELIEYDNGLVDALQYDNLNNAIVDNDLVVNNLFLNFNYTPTISSLINILKSNDIIYYGTSQEIHIHGKLKDHNNKINFGFGDEMDGKYKTIEEKDDNEYLRNIKSFQYLQNSNYKDMLDFIESGKFQVYIMGHSCGLSDRILLNKIFENHNCRSIKVFYYKNGDWDNYTDIIQNISRHFNKKEMMRERIVNKSLCQPLPQIQLPLKE